MTEWEEQVGYRKKGSSGAHTQEKTGLGQTQDHQLTGLLTWLKILLSCADAAKVIGLLWLQLGLGHWLALFPLDLE